MQRYLEFTPPNAELRKEVEEIISIQPSQDVEKTLAEKGRALRNLMSKWKNVISQGFTDEVQKIINWSDKPVSAGDRPQLPHRDAFDSKDPDQMEEYKNKVEKVFAELLDWERRKQAYSRINLGELDPHNRHKEVCQGLEGLKSWLAPRESKLVTLPSGAKVVCMDSGQFPGHMIAEIPPRQKDIERMKYLANLNYQADQAGFRIFLPEQIERKKEQLKRSNDELREDLMKMKKDKLQEVCDKAGVEYDEEMTKAELIDLLMQKGEVSDDAEGAPG